MKTLIISDIHGNLPALQAVFAEEELFDQCLFLGDVVDYGPFPHECIELLEGRMTAGVLGNHDNALARGVDCGCRGDFKRFSEETRAWHQALVTAADRKFLKSLPELRKIKIDGQSILLAHATPSGDLFHYPSDAEVDQAVRDMPDEIVLLGHTHVQFMRFVGETLVVNPGSVGLARDGGSACYAVLLDGKLHLHRLSYNVEETISALQRSPVSQATKDGLTRVLKGLPLL